MTDEFNPQVAADDFYQFVKGDLDDEKIRVFLCGESLDETRTIESQIDSNLRAYLKVKIEERVKGCEVVLAEHKNLIDAYSRAAGDGNPKHHNLVDYELHLAKWVDLIIIVVATPGSIAELGMFAVTKQVTPKLLIFFDPSHGFRSYIWNGPVRAATAASRASKVIVMEYTKSDQILEAAINRVREEKAIKRSGKLLADER